MKGRPAVAVAIATHDRPHLIGDCIASAVAALGPGEEVLVIESGSGTFEAGAGPVSVHHVDAKEKTVKMNEAFRRTDAEVILFSDDDCLFAPGWAAAMGQVFNDPDVGIAFGPVVGISTAPGGPPGAVLPPGPAPLQTWAFAHGPSMAVRRAAAFDVGGFDERLGPGARVHGEEADLVLRLRERGWRCILADAPPVTHVEWRTAEEDRANFRVYARGAGAYIGAALRRRPGANAKLFALLSQHEWQLARDRLRSDRGFALEILGAYARGVATGYRLPPRRYL